MFIRPIAGQTAALIALSLICGCSSAAVWASIPHGENDWSDPKDNYWNW